MRSSIFPYYFANVHNLFIHDLYHACDLFFCHLQPIKICFIYLKFINPHKNFPLFFLIQLLSWSQPWFHIILKENDGVRKKGKKNHSLINLRPSFKFYELYIFLICKQYQKIHYGKSLIFGFVPCFCIINVMMTFLPFNLPPKYPYFVHDCCGRDIYVRSWFFRHFFLIWINF